MILTAILGSWSFMVHGSRLMVNGHLWFMVKG